SSLSEASVASTLPRRTLTERERERTTTASARSAPAARARSISSAARDRRISESIAEVIVYLSLPLHLLCGRQGIKGRCPDLPHMPTADPATWRHRRRRLR